MDFDTTFTDIVAGLGEEPGYVNVIFRQHAANYRLAADRADARKQLDNARASLKRKKRVQVVVRDTEIVSITLL